VRDPERGSVAAATSECSSATRVWRAVAPVDEQLGDLMPSASCRVGEYAAARSSAAPTVIVRRPRPGLRIDRPAHDRRAEVAQAPHHAEQLRRGPMSRRRRIRGPARRRATVAAGAIDRLRPRPGVRRGCCRLLLPTPKRSASAREAERQLLQKALLHDDRCRDAQRAAAPPERTAAQSAGPMARRGRLPATATAMDRSRARPSWGPARSPLPGTRAGPTERAHALAWAIAGMPAAWSSACARPAQSRDPPPNSVRNS
jgi:hypothetical protein